MLYISDAYKYITTLESANNALESLINLKPKEIGLDTETTGLDPHTSKVRLIQLSVLGKRKTKTVFLTYIFDVFALGVENTSKLFNNFLSKLSNTVLVGHNLSFEIKMGWSINIDFTVLSMFDTMIASKLVSAGISSDAHGLKDLCERYLSITLDKTYQTSDWEVEKLDSNQLAYAAHDSQVILYLKKILDRELINLDLVYLAYSLEFPLIKVIASMEYLGIKTSLEKLNQITPIYNSIQEEAIEEFYSYIPERTVREDLFGRVIDPGILFSSPAQVLQVLRNLKVPDPLFQFPGAVYYKQGDIDTYPFTGFDFDLMAIKYYAGPKISACNLAESVLANNAYKVKAHTLKEHSKAVEAYAKFLEEEKENKASPVWAEIDRLAKIVSGGKNIVLTCNCSNNLPCHARDVLKPAIESRVEDNKLITSTSSDRLKLLDVNDFPILAPIIKYKGISKLITSYLNSIPTLINSKTNRLHTEFNQLVSTGRLSSSNPNIQNIPRPGKFDIAKENSIRACFVPEDGYVFVGADYSQIELRIIAEVTNDPLMLQEFIEDKDPYASTAAGLNNLKYEDLIVINENGTHTIKKEYKTLRQNAKAIRLGLNYGMMPKKLKIYAQSTYGVNLTLEEATKARESYFKLYSELQNYHNKFKDKTLLEARTLPPFNRLRRWSKYPGIPQLCNFPIQGTGADIVKYALILIYDKLLTDGYHPLYNRDVFIVSCIHDEIILEVKNEPKLIDYAVNLLNTKMVEAAKVSLKVCPVAVEASVLNSLADK